MHEAGHAVPLRALDLEIGRRLARPRGLRPDAGVARRERVVGQPGPVAPDRRVEALGAARIDGVVDALDPFDVRAETRLAREVERHVHAEPAGLGYGIDEPGKWRAAAERVVIPLRIELARREARRIALDRLRHARRAQAGA